MQGFTSKLRGEEAVGLKEMTGIWAFEGHVTATNLFIIQEVWITNKLCLKLHTQTPYVDGIIKVLPFNPSN